MILIFASAFPCAFNLPYFSIIRHHPVRTVQGPRESRHGLLLLFILSQLWLDYWKKTLIVKGRLLKKSKIQKGMSEEKFRTNKERKKLFITKVFLGRRRQLTNLLFTYAIKSSKINCFHTPPISFHTTVMSYFLLTCVVYKPSKRLIGYVSQALKDGCFRRVMLKRVTSSIDSIYHSRTRNPSSYIAA